VIVGELFDVALLGRITSGLRRAGNIGIALSPADRISKRREQIAKWFRCKDCRKTYTEEHKRPLGVRDDRPDREGRLDDRGASCGLNSHLLYTGSR